MPCSAVTLSLATISAIVAVALLAIAFSTDNWLSYEVKRNNIQVSVRASVRVGSKCDRSNRRMSIPIVLHLHFMFCF